MLSNLQLNPSGFQSAAEYVNSLQSIWSYPDREIALPQYIDDNTAYLREDLYEQMLYDAQVRANVNLIIYGIIGGGIEVEPVTNATRDREVAGFIKRALLEEIEETPLLTDTLPDMLMAMATGNRICEIVWNTPSESFDRKSWTIRRAKVKDRHRVTFWVDSQSNVTGIAARNTWLSRENFPPGVVFPQTDTSVAVFPLRPDAFKDNFGWISWKPKNGLPTGTSDLQSAYTSWWYKQQICPEYMKYMANFAIGSLWMELSENASTGRRNTIATDGTETDDMLSPTDRGVAMLQQFQNMSVMAVENGTKINTIQSTSDGRPFTLALDHFDTQISLSITGQNAANSKDGSAGRAPVIGQEILNGPIKYGCMKGEAFLQRFFVNPIMRKNYSRLVRPPRVRLPGQNRDDFLTAATAVSKLLATNTMPPEMWSELFMKAGLDVPDPATLAKLEANFWLQKENEAKMPPPKPFGGN